MEKEIISRLSSSMDRRDEGPNVLLAQSIAKKNDAAAVKELVDNLDNKNKGIQNDCIKVLYETGEIKPRLISGYAKKFIGLLDHKNNRLQWGAMTALSTIVQENPKVIYDHLSKIAEASDKGSVITKDNFVKILTGLCANKKYAQHAFFMLNDELMKCPVNQLPMYAENAVPVVDQNNMGTFVKTLQLRLKDIDKDSKRKRVEKVIKRFAKPTKPM
jgi:hypothetical protein